MPGQQPTRPSASTVTQRVLGPAPRGRPVVVPPKNLKLGKDKSEKPGYRLLWQKIKPEAMQSAENLMPGDTIPPGLKPQALSYVNARKQRREHL